MQKQIDKTKPYELLGLDCACSYKAEADNRITSGVVCAKHHNELLQATREETAKQVFKEILAWAEDGRLTVYPAHYFIAGLKAIEDSLTTKTKKKSKYTHPLHPTWTSDDGINWTEDK